MDSQTPSAPHLKYFLYSFSLLAIPYTTRLTSWFRSAPTYGRNQLFTTGLVVLLYNVCYLTLSPGFEIPLAQAGDGLSSLWVVGCSGKLGGVSALYSCFVSVAFYCPATLTSNPSLNFAQVLQAITASPARAARRDGG
ncbi:uncharacterized protein F5891DRAFT_1196562 [Suillus fuscotomentosus]|uniref:Uncharacterized protein n=1 Tax=Suillus fuscotomentosus TaxID=1912939 RepID=A0AAD4DSV6_9AGAM|nr:uncharacterized protein F5891DRAFT_1196562 [Suillus fuscotomentosus]KAG1893330.1 hypothetical protein F5891DRAFT_1196562 [Suillus fuscotomentosus]